MESPKKVIQQKSSPPSQTPQYRAVKMGKTCMRRFTKEEALPKVKHEIHKKVTAKGIRMQLLKKFNKKEEIVWNR